MAKNATMKDGRPEGSDKEGGRAPTATEERVAAYNDYKSTTAENVARFTAPDGSIADPLGLALAQGQALADLAVAAGPEIFSIFTEGVGNLIPDF